MRRRRSTTGWTAAALVVVAMTAVPLGVGAGAWAGTPSSVHHQDDVPPTDPPTDPPTSGGTPTDPSTSPTDVPTDTGTTAPTDTGTTAPTDPPSPTSTATPTPTDTTVSTPTGPPSATPTDPPSSSTEAPSSSSTTTTSTTTTTTAPVAPPDTPTPSPTATTPVPSTPNILVIKTDDQVMDRLSRMQAFMPSVAAYFGANGREFLNSYVSSPSCCQSRASTYVGQYPHNEGVWSQSLGASLDTTGGLGVYLQKAGYRTGIVGKYLNLVWHSPPGYDDWTTVRGECKGLSTEFCGDGGLPVWYYNFQVEDNTSARDAAGAASRATSAYQVLGSQKTGSNYNTTWEAQRFTDYLSSDLATPSRPWYLEWDPTAPHTHDTLPVMPDPRYAALPVPGCTPPLESDRSDKPPWVQQWPVGNYTFGAKTVCPTSQRTLKSVDDAFAQIIAQLAASGQLTRTLIVFTSDNGLMNGEHNLIRKYVGYEPSIRVPLLLAWPGHIAPGTDDRLVSNIDILPTVLDAVGIAPLTARPMDGVSLLRAKGHAMILSEYRADPGYVQPKPTPIPTWAAMTNSRLSTSRPSPTSPARSSPSASTTTSTPTPTS